MNRNTNWVDVLAQLADRGMTQAQIATACGSSQTTISEIARGSTKQPSFALGSALLELLDTAPLQPESVTLTVAGLEVTITVKPMEAHNK